MRRTFLTHQVCGCWSQTACNDHSWQKRVLVQRSTAYWWDQSSDDLTELRVKACLMTRCCRTSTHHSPAAVFNTAKLHLHLNQNSTTGNYYNFATVNFSNIGNYRPHFLQQLSFNAITGAMSRWDESGCITFTTDPQLLFELTSNLTLGTVAKLTQDHLWLGPQIHHGYWNWINVRSFRNQSLFI